MKPLIVLLATFVISFFAIEFLQSNYNIAFSARIAMSVMLLFTSLAHFAFIKGMTMMLPGFIPFKRALVYITGVVEIIAAVILLIPQYTKLTGWFLIAFFILLLPANINAAIKHIDYQKGSYDGAGTSYLWFRVPLQLFFIAWIYFSAIAN